MTLIAQFDVTQDPPVVTTLYDYGDDAVPTIMQPPEYMDVSDADPSPQPGSVYDEQAGWQHPPPAVDTAAWAHESVVRNQAFLGIESPTEAEYHGQVVALTLQVDAILRGQYPGVPPALDMPGAPGASPPLVDPGWTGGTVPPELEGGPPTVDLEPVEPPDEEPPPDESPPPEPVPPTASFTWSPTKPTRMDPTNFDATDSAEGSAPIARYDWSFERDGDTPDAGATPTHAFTKRGTFNVTLAVTDDDGQTDETTTTITV